VITEINDRLARKADRAGRQGARAPHPWTGAGSSSAARGGASRPSRRPGQRDRLRRPADAGAGSSRRGVVRRLRSSACATRSSAAASPPVPRANMAANPAWRLPLRGWKGRLLGVDRRPRRRGPCLRSQIFFDFRPLYGDEGLSRRLREHLSSVIAAHAGLSRFSREPDREEPAAAGLPAPVRRREGGEHRDRLNLKLKGLAPIIDLARLFALEKAPPRPARSTASGRCGSGTRSSAGTARSSSRPSSS